MNRKNTEINKMSTKLKLIAYCKIIVSVNDDMLG